MRCLSLVDRLVYPCLTHHYEGVDAHTQTRIRNWHVSQALAAMGKVLRAAIRMQRIGVPFVAA